MLFHHNCSLLRSVGSSDMHYLIYWLGADSQFRLWSIFILQLLKLWEGGIWESSNSRLGGQSVIVGLSVSYLLVVSQLSLGGQSVIVGWSVSYLASQTPKQTCYTWPICWIDLHGTFFCEAQPRGSRVLKFLYNISIQSNFVSQTFSTVFKSSKWLPYYLQQGRDSGRTCSTFSDSSCFIWREKYVFNCFAKYFNIYIYLFSFIQK